MAIDNYADLKSIIKSYLHRDDLDDLIPIFITLAEARINKDLRLRYMEKRSTLTITEEDAFQGLPDDFQEMRSIQRTTGSGRIPVKQMSQMQMDQVYGGGSGDTNAFAIHGFQIEFRLIPPVDTVFEMDYFARLDNFVDDTDSNLLLVQNPNIYIYACMIEAIPYLEGEAEQLNRWVKMYQKDVEALNNRAEDGRMLGGDASINDYGMMRP